MGEKSGFEKLNSSLRGLFSPLAEEAGRVRNGGPCAGLEMMLRGSGIGVGPLYLEGVGELLGMLTQSAGRHAFYDYLKKIGLAHLLLLVETGEAVAAALDLLGVVWIEVEMDPTATDGQRPRTFNLKPMNYNPKKTGGSKSKKSKPKPAAPQPVAPKQKQQTQVLPQVSLLSETALQQLLNSLLTPIASAAAAPATSAAPAAGAQATRPASSPYLDALKGTRISKGGEGTAPAVAESKANETAEVNKTAEAAGANAEANTGANANADAKPSWGDLDYWDRLERNGADGTDGADGAGNAHGTGNADGAGNAHGTGNADGAGDADGAGNADSAGSADYEGPWEPAKVGRKNRGKLATVVESRADEDDYA